MIVRGYKEKLKRPFTFNCFATTKSASSIKYFGCENFDRIFIFEDLKRS